MKPRQETTVEECTCQTCSNTFQGEVTTYLTFIPPRELRPRECPECRQERETAEKEEEEKEAELLRTALREQWRPTCGIPLELLATKFDHLDPDFQPKAQKLCLKWAEEFSFDAPKASPSMLLYSPGPGVSKTTLMACIANFLIDKWRGDPLTRRSPIVFLSGPRLVRRIRNTFDIRDQDYAHEREEDVYRQLQGVPLLMLDDVGKEQPRSYRFTQEIYWYIIDERVKAGLPVVVSSRLPIEGEESLEKVIGVDTVDRLYGMCHGQIITMKGPSYRKIKKIA